MAIASYLSNFLNATGGIAYEWDLQNDHITWYGAWQRLFKAGPAPDNMQRLLAVIVPDDQASFFGSENPVLDRHFRIRLPDNKIAAVHEYGMQEYLGGRVVMQRGVLEYREAETAVTTGNQAKQGHDLLTDCINRDEMLRYITAAIEAAQGSRRDPTYLVIGIDKMSFVNEAVGMSAGDALLRGVAERLRQMLPERAQLARVGGDMFSILLNDTVAQDYARLSARILQSFRDHPVVTPVTPLHITVSIGGVRVTPRIQSAAEVMIYAEQALHEARQRGRNLFVEYNDSPERAQETRQLLELSGRIKSAFKNDGFRLAFQPVVEASTGKHLFHEALVRMFDEDGKPVSAASFVPAIEQLGLAFELDKRVLHLAIQEMMQHKDLSLAINISGLTAAQSDWPDYMKRVLSPHPDVASRLIVEITETAAIVDVSETRRFVDTLRSMGGRVALDDFGAGFTSIRHLRSLGLAIMKIDKDLLHNLEQNREQQHLVRTLIHLASGLGLKTVVEGVETTEIAEWFKMERVDMMQGYFFGKPTLDPPWRDKKSVSNDIVPQAVATV